MDYNEIIKKKNILLDLNIPESEIERHLPDYKKILVLKELGFTDQEIQDHINNQAQYASQNESLSKLPENLMAYHDIKEAFVIFLDIVYNYGNYSDAQAEEVMTEILEKQKFLVPEGASTIKIDGITYDLPKDKIL